MRDRALLASLAATSFFLGAQVGHEAADRPLPWEWTAVPLACTTALTFARLVPRYAFTGIEFALVYTALAFAWLDAGAAYARALVAGPLLLVWLDLGHAHGLVGYDPSRRGFRVSRLSSYAFVRALGDAAVRRGVVGEGPARLLPLLLGTLETLGMAVQPYLDSYAFPPRSLRFVAYSVHKSAVLVLLPLLEDAVLRPRM